jgi:hypothetical protein
MPGHFKTTLTAWGFLLFTMILNIFSNHICSYFITNCANKIAIFPKFCTPKLLLYFWVFLKYYTRTYTLQHPYYFRNTVPWWKRQKYMNVILRNLQGVYFKVMVFSNLFKYLFYTFFDITAQYLFSIFRGPYQMALCIIYRMARSFKFHAIGISYFFLPLAGELFIPLYKTGYSSSNFA